MGTRRKTITKKQQKTILDKVEKFKDRMFPSLGSIVCLVEGVLCSEAPRVTFFHCQEEDNGIYLIDFVFTDDSGEYYSRKVEVEVQFIEGKFLSPKIGFKILDIKFPEDNI